MDARAIGSAEAGNRSFSHRVGRPSLIFITIAQILRLEEVLVSCSTEAKLRITLVEYTSRVGTVKRILKVLTYIAVGLYLLVDAIFMTLAKPIADWIAEHVALRRLRDWIKSLSPYPSLALFSVPVIVLEPIKPIAAYLAATGQFLSGAVTFIIGELLKLVLVERLFSLTREKLMHIPTFARLYEMYSHAIAWLKETEAWRTVQSLVKSARNFFRSIGARATYWMLRRRNRKTRSLSG